MRLTVTLPTESSTMPAEDLIQLAIRAEELGYEGIWLPDHLLLPDGFDRNLGGVYEPLVTLSYIAAVTERITLGTAVLLLPLRNPFAVAKQAAALVQLSRGRFIFGIGVGWSEQEFESVGADFHRRGHVTDEGLRLIRHLHTVGHGPFESDVFPFAEGVFAPMPTYPMPISIGGNSDAALKRAARFGDIWYGDALTPDELRERVATLRALTDRKIMVANQVSWRGPTDSIEDFVANLEAWRSAGADNLSVWFGPVEGTIERMEALARRCLP